MSEYSEKIRRALIAIIDSRIPLATEWGNVKSVSGKTCTVTIDELDIPDILLGFDNSGVIVYPKVGSDVLVLYVSNQKTIGVIVYATQTDKVEIMGNVNGGLIKVDNLKTQYDTALDAIVAACVAGFTAQAGIDGSIGLNAFNAAKTAIIHLNKTPLENTKIKHGNG